MAGGPYAGVGDEEDSTKAKIAGQLSDTRHRTRTKDDAGPGLEIERNHLK